MDEDVVLVALVVFAFSLGGGKKRCYLFGLLAQSLATPSKQVRSWLQLQNLQVPPRFKTIDSPAQCKDVAGTVRQALMAHPVMFCINQSKIRMRAKWNRNARTRLIERQRHIDWVAVWAWFEKERLFRFVGRSCRDELREDDFRVVCKCSKRITEKVKVEVGGVVGKCFVVSRKETVVMVHSFGENHSEFDTVFDYVGTLCQWFNGHAMYRFMRDEIMECSKGQMFQYRDAIRHSLKE
jgi:hypothetical protein